ncbi:Histidine--tRNA ligase [Candidatus Gugararchaeum adminiculabundum]|nr:Histidine--tRNA ligase [Candidatus Gugararchaeum adminiculabundum]
MTNTNATFGLPRGMRDIEPLEMARKLWVEETITKSIRGFGFSFVEPSPLENMETLVAKSGEGVRNEIYGFKDKADREIGLRFDLTVGLARMVAGKMDWAKPIKLAAISNMWRYDEPQFGRYRCFYQWDVEVFGVAGVEADAEVISAGVGALESLGLKEFEVRINSRELVEGLLEEAGVSADKTSSAMRAIDKLAKVGKAKVLSELKAAGVSEKAGSKVLELCGTRGNLKDTVKLVKVKGSNGKNEKIASGTAKLEKLAELLGAYGCLDRCVLDLSVVRGIDYYTGIVYEIYDTASPELGAIAGGGRFDGLVKVFNGGDVPATGIAGGIERLMLSLEKAKAYPRILEAAEVVVVPVNEKMYNEALKIAAKIREAGISCDIDLLKRNLSKQVSGAAKKGARFAFIVGERELKEKKVNVRNLETGKEELKGLDEAVKYVKGN